MIGRLRVKPVVIGREAIARAIRQLIMGSGANTITLELDQDSASRLAADLDSMERTSSRSQPYRARVTGAIRGETDQ